METTNVICVLSCLGLKQTLILTEHGVPTLQDPGVVWRLLKRLTYPIASKVVVLTEDVQRYFRNLMGIECAVIPNPVFAESGVVSKPRIYRDSFKEGEFFQIVAAGRLSYEKGFDLLLLAFAEMVKHRQDVRLTIFGDGTDRPLLLNLVDRLKLDKFVAFPGITSSLQSKLETADLFVLSSRYEAFANVLLEAMAVGTPVVAFNCPHGPAAILRHGFDGVLVEAENINNLAEEILTLLPDATKRSFLGNNALQVKSRFGLDHVLGLWDNLLSGLKKR